jgi:formylglycine-generating enzyme required for sulfatase activity
LADADQASNGKLKVFVSYSRKDEAFADELIAGLQLAGFEPYLDKHDIAAGENWEERLGRLIEAADTVVFVISPDAVTSERCSWEVDYTFQLKKRLFPVVWRRVDESSMPLRLKQLNYIFFDRPHSFGPSMLTLAVALKTDISWIREHSRIGEAAIRWGARGRAEALLFRGEELAAAKTWLAAQPKYAPEPTLLHHDFIKAGEDAELTRTNAERQRLEEMAAALEREKSAQVESGHALEREKIAIQKGKYLRTTIAVLMFGVILSLLGVIFKEPIGDFVFEQTTVRNYIATQVRPHVLTPSQERALVQGSTFKECASACPEMVVVPAGSFRMGSPESEPGRESKEGPVHKVSIGKQFAVGKFEVTWDEWQVCVAMRGCRGRLSDGGFGKGKRPVINVSWDQARSYVSWLSRMTGQTYRLMTEAEWEYAARAGTQTMYYFGNDPTEICKYANLADQSFLRGGYVNKVADCDDGKAETAPVGSYRANAFGLHDMLGNVREWVEDCYINSYRDAPKDGSSVPYESGCSRVIRGGSWYDFPQFLRVAYRSFNQPDDRYGLLGFRLARTLSSDR